MGTNLLNDARKRVIPIGFFGIRNASNDATPFVIDPKNSFVGMNTGMSAPLEQLDVRGNINVNNTVINHTNGIGVTIKGLDSSGIIGQVRIVADKTGWIDTQETTLVQISNNTNNNATFLGGKQGTNATLDRLQFSAKNTTITDALYSATPAPTSLFSLVATSSNDIVNVFNSASTLVLQLTTSGNLNLVGNTNITGNLNVTGNITANEMPIARLVSLSAPPTSATSGSPGDYYVDHTGAYFYAVDNKWYKSTVTPV
jgi:hypothetical protein